MVLRDPVKNPGRIPRWPGGGGGGGGGGAMPEKVEMEEALVSWGSTLRHRVW